MSNQIKEVYYTKLNKIWVDEDGVVCIEGLREAYLTIEEARATVKACEEVTKNSNRPFLVDIRMSKGADKESFKLFSSEGMSVLIKALAIIADSPLSKMMGNLFLSIYKPKYPTKLFTNKAIAKKWLFEFE